MGNHRLAGWACKRYGLFLLLLAGGNAFGQASLSSPGGVSSFNTRTGAVTLTSGDVTTALGFTPATLRANTFTGAQTISANGAASTPPIFVTGTWFSGGSTTTTKPQALVECNTVANSSNAWSTAGTGLGINACSGYIGDLINAQDNGSPVSG